jgi:ribosomal protein S18 acetylase RimI-like enzyme
MSNTDGLLDPAPDRSKQDLVGSLRPVRIVPKPQGYRPLSTFSCGHKGSRSEKIINEWAHDVSRGQRRNTGTVLVLEDIQRNLVGVGSFRVRPLGPRGDDSNANGDGTHTYYIHIIAVAGRYRGQRQSGGGRVGDILLNGILEQIVRQHPGSPQPKVWAIIAAGNTAAHTLFERHGFSRFGRINDHELVYTRPANMPIGKNAGRGRIGYRLLGRTRTQ